jgi:hypothetical protein
LGVTGTLPRDARTGRVLADALRDERHALAQLALTEAPRLLRAVE